MISRGIFSRTSRPSATPEPAFVLGAERAQDEGRKNSSVENTPAPAERRRLLCITGRTELDRAAADVGHALLSVMTKSRRRGVPTLR
jgi:hypothetical protein